MIKDLKDVKITEEMRDKIEERIKQIEAEIEKEFSEECIKDVMETLRELGDEDNSIGGERRKKMWKVLKKNFPKITNAVPVGKKDGKGILLQIMKV